MKNIFRTEAYWIVSILATAVIFAVFSNINNAYTSEVNVLVLAKNPQTASAIGQITADVQTIPLSLSFYDKLLENNSKIKDASAKLSADKRKAFWNKKISTKIINRSGVVKIEISDQDRSQAETIASQTVRDLSQVFSRYYDIKTDLDIRIIDGPITETGKKYGAGAILPLSLAIAFLAVYFSFVLASMIEKTIFGTADKSEKTVAAKQQKTPEFQINSQEYQIIPKAKVVKEEIKKDQPVAHTHAPYTFDKKAAAPNNLPIAEEISFKENKTPTPEEVKERLNKLLSGKM